MGGIRFRELLFYVTFGAGLAFGTSSFTMLGGLFEIVPAPWVIVSVVFAGLVCAVISFSIAELASMYPSAPGVRTYLKTAFSNRVSLLLVYLYLMFMVLVAGVEAYMFALATRGVFAQVSPTAVVLGLMVFTIVVNLLGLELPRVLQILTTLLLIVTVCVLGAYGGLQANATGPEPPVWPNQVNILVALPAAIGMAIYLFIGFEWVTMLGFSPESYKRLIPVSLPLAILTNVIAYSLCVIGFWAQLAPQEVAGAPIPQLAYFRHLFGPSGSFVAWGLSLLAVFSTFNAGIIGGSRLIYVLTREGNLPGWCGTMSLRTGAPTGAILLLGCLSIVSSLVVVRYELELVAAVVGAAIVSFVYSAFMLATIRLRRTQPDARRTFRTPVARSVQWAVIVILPAMGTASLCAQPGLRFEPLIMAICLVLLASLLVRWSVLNQVRVPALGRS